MNTKAIETMIADELGQLAMNDLPAKELVKPITGTVENWLNSHNKLTNVQRNKLNRGKVSYQANNKLITANCSNAKCGGHVALNPSKVKLAGLSLSCKVCNSPMLLNVKE